MLGDATALRRALLDDTFVNCLCLIVAFLSFTAVTQTKQQECGVGSLFDRLFQPACDPFELLWIRWGVRGSDYADASGSGYLDITRVCPERLAKVQVLLLIMAMTTKEHGQHNLAVSNIGQSFIAAIKLLGDVNTT